MRLYVPGEGDETRLDGKSYRRLTAIDWLVPIEPYRGETFHVELVLVWPAETIFVGSNTPIASEPETDFTSLGSVKAMLGRLGPWFVTL